MWLLHLQDLFLDEICRRLMIAYDDVFAVLGAISLGSYNSMLRKQDGRLWMTGLIERSDDAGNVTILQWNFFRLTTLSGVEAMDAKTNHSICLLYTSPSPRDRQKSRMPSSA